MNKKHFILRKKLGRLLLLFIVFSVFMYCNPGTEEESTVITDEIETEEQLAGNVMYSVPAPSDMAGLLIDNPNLIFNPEFLNPISNHQRYNTNKKLALNLGIYIADLSYAGYFEQNQFSKEYFDITKRISEELGITNAIGEKNAQTIIEQKPDKEQLIRIINETFMNTDAYLLENKRHDIMAMILVGGWIEAQYIATAYTDCKTDKHPDLTQSILDQAISIDIMKRMLEQAEQDVDLSDLKTDFKKIEKLYSKMGDKPSEVEFKEFCELIKSIRDKYTA